MSLLTVQALDYKKKVNRGCATEKRALGFCGHPAARTFNVHTFNHSAQLRSPRAIRHNFKRCTPHGSLELFPRVIVQCLSFFFFRENSRVFGAAKRIAKSRRIHLRKKRFSPLKNVVAQLCTSLVSKTNRTSTSSNRVNRVNQITIQYEFSHQTSRGMSRGATHFSVRVFLSSFPLSPSESGRAMSCNDAGRRSSPILIFYHQTPPGHFMHN